MKILFAVCELVVHAHVKNCSENGSFKKTNFGKNYTKYLFQNICQVIRRHAVKDGLLKWTTPIIFYFEEQGFRIPFGNISNDNCEQRSNKQCSNKEYNQCSYDQCRENCVFCYDSIYHTWVSFESLISKIGM